MDVLTYIQIFAWAALGAFAVTGAVLMVEKIRDIRSWNSCWTDKKVEKLIAKFHKRFDKLIIRYKDFFDKAELGTMIQSAAGRNVCPLPLEEEAKKWRCKYDGLHTEILRAWETVDNLQKALDDLQTRDKASEPRRNPPKKKTTGAKK
ncbi:MAG: hypothetical protein IJB97_05400 [Clostridia bacterium]|nr:hypothetical protein [Clostridia bacterium]